MTCGWHSPWHVGGIANVSAIVHENTAVHVWGCLPTALPVRPSPMPCSAAHSTVVQESVQAVQRYKNKYRQYRGVGISDCSTEVHESV